MLERVETLAEAIPTPDDLIRVAAVATTRMH